MHAVPKASVGLRPDADPSTCKAIVTLRTDADPALRRDKNIQRRLIRDMLSGAGWLAPTVVAGMADASDFYFDELARVDMPSLTSGRIALLGDAGFCGSPLTGMGTAMALVGPYILAGEIARTPADPMAALARYDAAVTPFLDRAKQLPGGGIAMMLPRSEIGLKAAQTMGKLMTTRIMRPVMTRMLSGTEDCVLPSY
ncbi:hypothetical protein [Nocardia sp. CC201C]|uniref:hypothetical protein n=1 Tax=Nocardia sp. CC201C TaxID=3044575 RepID=UPI0024A7C794|nr:hypothetical protein [Nocardia sp. CC201C]